MNVRGPLLLALLGFLVVTIGGSPVDAQSVGSDIVTTPGGGRLRGTVTEYEPDQRVVIMLADGTSRTLGPGEFTGVRFGDDVPSTAAPAPAGDVSAPPSTPVAESGSSPPVPVERWSTPARYGTTLDTDWENVALAGSTRNPQGAVHFGVQLQAGFWVPMKDFFSSAAFAFLGGAMPFVDFTIGERGSLRLGALVDLSPQAILFGGLSRTLGIGPRILFGHDVNPGLVFRIGLDALLVMFGDAIGPEIKVRAELASRLLPSRELEIGVGLGIGTTPNLRGSSVVQGLVVPAFDLFAAWVFE